MGIYRSSHDNFPVFRIFDKGLHLNMGQAPVQNHLDNLLNLVGEGKVVLDDIISHTLSLSEVSHAYEIFNDKKDDCVKVILKP